MSLKKSCSRGEMRNTECTVVNIKSQEGKENNGKCESCRNGSSMVDRSG